MMIMMMMMITTMNAIVLNDNMHLSKMVDYRQSAHDPPTIFRLYSLGFLVESKAKGQDYVDGAQGT